MRNSTGVSPSAGATAAIAEDELDFPALRGSSVPPLEELQRGVIGMMTGFGFPEILVSIFRDFRAGREERARDTFYRYLPLIRYENQPGLNLPLRKLVYTIRGAMDHAEPRRPYPPLDDVTLLELDALLARAGLRRLRTSSFMLGLNRLYVIGKSR